MKFSYKRYGPDTFRPIIPIRLKNGEASVQYEVLVDSGADMCVFDAEIGEILGIDVKKGAPKEVFGVGGKASIYYLHTIEIEVGGWPYRISAGFMPNVAGRTMAHGIVGQKGFFEYFKVIFDRREEEVELRRKGS